MTSEAPVQSEIRLLAGEHPALQLWRNNSGVLKNEHGTPVRFGLGNDSARVNKRLKSPDLIGFRIVQVTPHMIGHHVPIFLGVDAKPPDWRFRESDDRAVAQNRFLHIIRQAGGYGDFCRTLDEFKGLVGI